MKPIISVEGLGKSYTIRHEGQTHYKSLREEIFKLPSRLLRRGGQSREEFWALKDVSFDIMPGDRVGIIGRNGAGKSTLLKLLSRITEPTTGRITLRGRVASLLEVGTGFHPELTGRENIYLNGAILGMTRSEVRRKFDEIVDFAGVEKFLDTPVKRYSSGMYVRLAFAVAAHLEPEILIVDEVLAVGDAAFQKKCLGKMEAVSKEGRTVLFVSHNMAAVQQLCQKGILLENARLKVNSSVEMAIDMYQNCHGCGRNLSQNSETTTRDLIDRRPFGCVHKIISKIRLMTLESELKNIFTMLSGVKLEIFLNDIDIYPDIDFGISIFNESGVRLVTYTTWMMGVKLDKKAKKLVLIIPEMIFPPGEYTINICAARKLAGEYIDRIEPAIKFYIVDSDIFHTGYGYSRGEGITYQKGILEFSI
ncbi:ABC transporter ATP-binding protein [Desulfovibrio fairfieldensis]|uniref:ABC transporter ATP-binding protein n=1 Tax=Desulfovibrio fairfieldensis TaxID=44742 RepID=UPI0009FA84FB|nr:ABC transporter ATP-binding protein [Desulfovibrio fairfieldensis]